MNKTIRFALILATVALVQPLHAASSTQMNVSVEVVARTIFNVTSQPASVNVTSADVARGYVEIPAAIAFQVHSNARNGFTIQFQPVAEPFRQAQISWGTTTATVGSDGSWVAQQYEQGVRSGSMSVRLSLAPSAIAATYAWPISVDANSL